MKLERLHLKRFRTYEDLSVAFDRRLNFITGRNASGKTNVLEAISLLSLGKSFRGASDQDMVAESQNGYYIGSRYLRRDQGFRLEMGCDLSGRSLKRRIKLNDKQLPGRQALIGNLVTVIFSPADISIVEGGPAYRRRFLDMVLSSHDPDYLKTLILYNRALKQRNAVLKRIKKGLARPEDLGPWNINLANFAAGITRAREKFVVDFQEIFSSSLERISGRRDEIQLSLALSSDREKEDFASALEAYVKRDSIMGYTTVGPHRHNLNFENRGRDITRFGSQGQKRSLVLALRIAQFYYLRRNLGLSPILLIDDVIRELDASRRNSFVELLHECGQAVFTTPDLDGLEGFIHEMRDETAIFDIPEIGRLERRESVP